jgi:hypothetical protein
MKSHVISMAEFAELFKPEKEETVQPQTEITGTMGEGGVSMKSHVISMAEYAEMMKPEPVDRGTYSYFDSWSKDFDKRGARVNAEEMYGREREVTVFDGSPQSKQSSMWVLPKDTTPKTYNEGWQVNKGGGWEDVADQNVPTIMGEKGLSTLSHVKYRQKPGSPSVGSSQTTAPSTSSFPAATSFSASLGGGSRVQSNLSSIFSSVMNKMPTVEAQVQTGGNQAQLGMVVVGAGRIGSRTITVTTNTDASSSWSSTSGSTQTTQTGFSVNNNHTQPPYTGRDA